MPSSGWYSKQLNKAALMYKLGIAIHRNKLVWINGPSLPSWTERQNIFDKPDGLKSKIPDGKKSIVNEGYRDDPKKLSNQNTF
jgi:hypothetical protein